MKYRIIKTKGTTKSMVKVKPQAMPNKTNDKRCPVCNAPYVLAEARRQGSRDFYDWYINVSPVWYAIRKWAMQRAGNKCERCGSTFNLSVHHLTYNNLGKEHPEDLKVLCQSCHEKAHGIG
jgi:5-methylcytosine-specific restriction endonuclease McrA